MNNFELVISVIGGIVASAFGWFMKMLFNRQENLDARIDQLDKEVSSQFNHIELQLAEVRRELTENSLRDQSNQEKILFMLETQAKMLHKIEDKIAEYDKNISKFYQLNPDLKNPDI